MKNEQRIRSRARAPRAERREPDQGARAESFPIVGLGASAGGLEAFTEFLRALAPDTGMGFVLIQHLDPEHESALVQLLSRATTLPVRQIDNGQRVESDHVYVIPRDTTLSIADGILKLEPRARTRQPHRPIDAFFESLAEDRREAAVGVVLSGTASDGTLGLETIKAEGGITFAQDDSARYDSMPHSAVAAGCVDMVLAPAEIARELARIAKHPYLTGPAGGESPAEADRAAATAHAEDRSPLPSGGHGTPRTDAKRARDEAERSPAKGAQGRAAKTADDGYRKILLLLRNHCGVDFSLYKSTTIQRRINRRVIVSRHDTLAAYADFLRGNGKELDALYSDVLISVTSFFRNPETFDVLQRDVLPELLEQRGDDPIRCWILGCSTGQEAYSMAIAFVEAMEKAPRTRTLQVFATDLNDALLDKARHGLYARTLAEHVSPERLRRFFVEEQGGFRVSKVLRDMVVFARQNLLDDPPFSRMHLISCRNLLIYLEPSLQRKAIPTLHYALRPGGVLLLGASESVGAFTNLFEPIDRKHKIYSKKAVPTPLHLPIGKEHGERPSPVRLPLPRAPRVEPGSVERSGHELNIQREADRITINHFAPPGVLINAERQITQFRGPTGAYLEPPAGKASFDVLKMAREGLMLPLRAAITEADKENRTVRRENVRIRRNGTIQPVHLQVIPLKHASERNFLIVFEDAAAPERVVRGPSRPRAKSAREKKDEIDRAGELEIELTEMREYLQSKQEQHETINEELQAANEEVQSANEELQSINEELETSKEELESANEELTTLNEEMANRNAELTRANNDLLNLQASARLAIVLLGHDQVIRRFTQQAEKELDLLASDVGRAVSQVRHGLAKEGTAVDLERLGAEVIADVLEQEHEVRGKAGRWYLLRLRPYMTLDNRVDGVVLVLVDIDPLKRSELAVAAARDYAESIVATLREPLVVLDQKLRVETANPAFYRTFRVAPAETVGRLVYDLGNRQWDIPRLRELLEEIAPRNNSIESFQVEHDFQTIGKRIMLLNARRVPDADRDTSRVLLAIEDVTDRKRDEDAFRQSHVELQSHATELSRFNSVAVGREARMIELKKEVNELRRRLGEPARYPLEFEDEGTTAPDDMEEDRP